jgi:F-type H+-transporting ATPase subunit gamma
MFLAGEFDACTIVYNKFKSVIVQIVTRQRIIPFTPPLAAVPSAAPEAPAASSAVYEYEPDEEEILASLLPRNLAVQLFRALLENNASEQGARMSAMDNATRNAGDMINKLTLNYNRTRQAAITRELIEIISGAEAI